MFVDTPTQERLPITTTRSPDYALAPKSPSERVSGLIQGLPEESQTHHDAVVAELVGLEDISELQTTLELYCEALEATDFSQVTELLSLVDGSEAVGEVAREQFISQVDSLLIGARAIHERGSAQVMTFGYNTSYGSLKDVDLVLEELARDVRDLRDLVARHGADGDITSLHAEALSRLDKYMFEGRVFRLSMEDLTGVVVFHGEGDGGSAVQLFEGQGGEEDANPGGVSVRKVELSRMASRRRLHEKIELVNKGDSETDNMFLARDEVPKTVVVYTSSKDFLDDVKGYGIAMKSMLIDYYRLPYDRRPNVLVYTDGFEPALRFKHTFQGFLFCSSRDELNNVLSLAKSQSTTLHEEMYDPEALAPRQREAYENSNLREWENRTADTYQSLKHIFEVVAERRLFSACADLWYLSFDFRTQDVDKMLEGQQTPGYKLFMEALRQYRRFREHSNPEAPLTWYEAFDIAMKSRGMDSRDFRVNTCLDVGTGEGRIAGMLARVGVKVLGIDISPEQLRKLKARVKEEGEGLRGEAERPGLSYPALLRLKDEGLLPGSILENDQTAADNLQTVEGSFFKLQRVLNQDLVDWQAKHPGVDIFKFFGVTPNNPYVLSDRRDMFSNVGFDMAMFNWHTFCEIGSPENQKMVLVQILNVLDRGGMLILEIPDRKIEPYASALRQYHQEHPDEPYGTIRDKKPDGFDGFEGEDLYPPRYFPDINELVLLLKSVGYEVSMDNVKTYLVQEEDEDGKGKMTLKEHFIVARKSVR